MSSRWPVDIDSRWWTVSCAIAGSKQYALLLTYFVRSCDVGRDGDKPEAEGAEPLAEWEQELLAGATAAPSPAPRRPTFNHRTPRSRKG